MSASDTDWESRIASAWNALDSLSPTSHVAEIDKLAAERPANDAAALFERAAARDTAGMEREAEGFYRQALAAEGLDSYRRSRGTIQLASTLRLLGRLSESEALLVELLEAHRQPGASRALHDEARAFLSLTYAAQGRMREAAGIALATLAPYLSRYNRSVAGNAAELASKVWQ
ncbi:MAG: tetratricopeptide repeat protein [Burkholderiales bacterium]|nr:tetratricopeptide repeat protein [Burkholderiales bacterium]